MAIYQINPGQKIRHFDGAQRKNVILQHPMTIEGPDEWQETFRGRMTRVDKSGDVSAASASGPAHERVDAIKKALADGDKSRATLQEALKKAEADAKADQAKHAEASQQHEHGGAPLKVSEVSGHIEGEEKVSTEGAAAGTSVPKGIETKRL